MIPNPRKNSGKGTELIHSQQRSFIRKAVFTINHAKIQSFLQEIYVEWNSTFNLAMVTFVDSLHCKSAFIHKSFIWHLVWNKWVDDDFLLS